MPFNIEIKVEYDDLDLVQHKLLELNAMYVGEDYQVDKYYSVNKGRLKIRKGNIEKNIIYYNRKEDSKLKESDVTLIPLIEPYGKYEQVLDNALECIVTVRKKRKIFFINSVKFHLDDVEDLGKFVEIEVIDPGREVSPEELKINCQYYIDYLELSSCKFVSESYSDLLIKKNNH